MKQRLAAAGGSTSPALALNSRLSPRKEAEFALAVEAKSLTPRSFGNASRVKWIRKTK